MAVTTRLRDLFEPRRRAPKVALEGASTNRVASGELKGYKSQTDQSWNLVMEDTPTLPAFQVDSLGHPGNIHLLFAGNIRPEESTSYLDNMELRRFTARGMFGKNLTLTSEVACHARFGSSYVSLEGAIQRPSFTTPFGVITLYENERREMSVAQMELEANGVREARQKFLAVLYPALDYLSYECDVPIHISTLGLFDKKYPVTTLFFVSPYLEKKITRSKHAFGPEIRAALALYREAKASGSAAYKILNYYKIIEGIQVIARPRLSKEAAERGVAMSQPRDIVPAHPDYPPIMAPFVGKKVGDFREHLLRDAYRNAVAHFALDDDAEKGAKLPPLDLGSPLDVGRMEDMVLPAELCARIVIDNYLNVAQQLVTAGSP